jgi:hypothetical protein
LTSENSFFGSKIELVNHREEYVLESSESVEIRFSRVNFLGILLPSDGGVSGLSLRDPALVGGGVLNGGLEFVLAK